MKPLVSGGSTVTPADVVTAMPPPSVSAKRISAVRSAPSSGDCFACAGMSTATITTTSENATMAATSGSAPLGMMLSSI